MKLYRRLLDYRDPNSLGSRLRRRRAHLLENAIQAAAQRLGGKIQLIDIGGTETYWQILSPGFLEGYVEQIVLINMERSDVADNRLFAMTVADACNLQRFSDNSFDFVHSNSVIEHVGEWERMISFAKEVRRLAPAHFIQTPYFWFPFEPHFGVPFFHWFPEQIRMGLALRYSLGHYHRCETVDEAVRYVQHARLLDARQLQYLFPDSLIHREKLGFMTKSLIAIKR